MAKDIYRFNISFLLLNKKAKGIYHCQVFSLSILFLLLMSTLSFSNQEISSAIIWHNGQQQSFSMEDPRHEQVLTEAIKIVKNAVDYYDSFFLESQLEKMKVEYRSVEILFPNKISLVLNNIGEEIHLNKLLLICENGRIKYIFWGSGKYQLDGAVLGSSESSSKIFNILESE